MSGLFLRLGFALNYGFVFLRSKGLGFIPRLYSSPQAILTLSQSARRDFVTLT